MTPTPADLATARGIVTIETDGFAWTVRIFSYSIRTYTHEETAIEFHAEICTTIATALREQRERDAGIVETFADAEDSFQDEVIYKAAAALRADTGETR